MTQYSENKSSSAAVIATVAAIALIGFSAMAIGRGDLERYLHTRKQKHRDKIAAIDGQIEAILEENVSMRQSLELLSTSLDLMGIQNEKLAASNKALAKALEEEHDSVLALMNFVSEESEEKLVLTKKLEEANIKLTAYTTGKSDKTDLPEDAKAKEFIA